MTPEQNEKLNTQQAPLLKMALEDLDKPIQADRDKLVAKVAWKRYKAYMAEGFTEFQALYLVKKND